MLLLKGGSTMSKFYLRTRHFLQEERGDQLLEVALIITLVVIVAMAGLQALGVNILGALNRAASAIGGG
jgi:Flp pilus assembly pilin Flp